MSDILKWTLEGMGNNLLITALCGIVPLIAGVLLTFISGKSKACAKVFEWLSLPFECICPVVFVCAVYYIIGQILHIGNLGKWWIFSALLSVCFWGYMPARHVESYSFVKNMVYNGLGLFAALFKWSFVGGYIAIEESLKTTQVITARTYNFNYYLIPLIFSLVILLVIEVARRLVKQLME